MKEKVISLEMLSTFGKILNEELGHSEEVDNETLRVSEDLEMMIRGNKPHTIPLNKFITKEFSIVKKYLML